MTWKEVTKGLSLEGVLDGGRLWLKPQSGKSNLLKQVQFKSDRPGFNLRRWLADENERPFERWQISQGLEKVKILR